MTSELKPCPFCLRPLKRSSGKFNPMAVCETDGCWMKEKQIAVPCDDPFSVKSWNTRTVPDVPELVRYEPDYWIDCGTYRLTMKQAANGEYVLHSQAAEIIAAEQQKTKDAEELAFRMDRFAQKYLRHMRNAEQRAEAAEAKLAQYEHVDEYGDVCIVMQQSEIDLANENLSLHEEIETLKNLISQYETQEPVAWVDENGMAAFTLGGISTVHTRFETCKSERFCFPLYASPAPTADLKAEVSKEIDGYIELYKNQDKVSRSHVLKGLSELRNRINKKGESNV